MFRNILQRTLALNVRAGSTAARKDQWDLCVGVLIERLPVVSKNLNEIESEFMKTLSQIEFENSLKADHEIRNEKDKLQQELIKSGKMEVELDADARNLQTAQDFEDLNVDELAKFKVAARVTEDDKTNNLKSLNRKLDQTLMLVCGEKIGKNDVVMLPQAQWVEGETLRQTAERIVNEKLGTDLKVHFYGHAPCGFYKYKYKPADKKDSVGSKVFFYRAAYKSGDIKDKNANLKWINEEELKGRVRDSYFRSVSQLFVS